MIHALIWFGLVGLSVVIPPAGGLGLLFGYVLGDKFFALVNLGGLIHFPLFVTEPVLAVLFARALALSWREKRLAEWDLGPKGPWFWFYLIGLINLAQGMAVSAPVLVLRDAVIVFYGVIAQITQAYVRSVRHARTVFVVVAAAIFLRLALHFAHPIFGHRSTTYGMYASFVSLTCLCTLPMWGRWRPVALGMIVVLVGVMTATDVRTVWVAFALAFLVIAVFHRLAHGALGHFRPAAGVVALSIALSVGFLRVTGSTQYDVIRAEFMSFFAGTHSPNLMTRIAMWEDAVQQVIPASHVFFDEFDRRILFPYYYGSSEKPNEEELHRIARTSTRYISQDPSATDILNNYEQPNSDLDPERAAAIGGNKALRTLFGVPFGTRFVPDRISAIHQVNRYDPHNSVIAVLYRTGVAGFAFFVWIVVRSWRRARRAVRRSIGMPDILALEAAMACLVYHLGHSMTDVTLENPFRGGALWLILGLMAALSGVFERDRPAD